DAGEAVREARARGGEGVDVRGLHDLVAVAAAVEAEVVGDQQDDVAPRRRVSVRRGDEREREDGPSEAHGVTPHRMVQTTYGVRRKHSMRAEGDRNFALRVTELFARLSDAGWLTSCLTDVEVTRAEPDVAEWSMRPKLSFVGGSIDTVLTIAERN